MCIMYNLILLQEVLLSDFWRHAPVKARFRASAPTSLGSSRYPPTLCLLLAARLEEFLPWRKCLTLRRIVGRDPRSIGTLWFS